jgi:hypothetical protein
MWQRKSHIVKNGFDNLTLLLIKKGKSLRPQIIQIANTESIIAKAGMKTISIAFFHSWGVLLLQDNNPQVFPSLCGEGKKSSILSRCLKRKTSIE